MWPSHPEMKVWLKPCCPARIDSWKWSGLQVNVQFYMSEEVVAIPGIDQKSVETKEEFHCTTENVSFMHMTINTLNWIEADQLQKLKLSFHILDLPIGVYATHETYNYLGHKFNIAGEWNQQVNGMAHQFITGLDLVDAAPVHVTFKQPAIRDIDFSNVQRLYVNVHIKKIILCEMDNKTVNMVGRWLCLNAHSTRCFIFQER